MGDLVLGFILALQRTVLVFHLPLCGHSRITQFYCDVLPILWLASETLKCKKPWSLSAPSSSSPSPFPWSPSHTSSLPLWSSDFTVGWHRAFSTFSSRLTVVFLQYGCHIYLHPNSSYDPEMSHVVSVVYTFVTLVLNLLIYSMRNKELRDASSK